MSFIFKHSYYKKIEKIIENEKVCKKLYISMNVELLAKYCQVSFPYYLIFIPTVLLDEY